MEEEQLNHPLPVTHLLQHTLRTFCNQQTSQWVYAVFWRILPRNYPPPKWDSSQGGAYDRSRGNRRNWILVWEDGFCNFNSNSEVQGLQPELFFKMSHEIYNYGEGLIGKVASEHTHKWIYKESNEHEINFLSAWHNSSDSQPRTWEAQFQSGIKTIALIAVREGVVQLGSLEKAAEDVNYAVLLRKNFGYIGSIPGVLLPHPSSSSSSSSLYNNFDTGLFGEPPVDAMWNFETPVFPNDTHPFCYDHFSQPQMKIAPSMSSLEALLSKLPSVVPPGGGFFESSQFMSADMAETAKDEADNGAGMAEYGLEGNDMGETSSTMSYFNQHHE